MHRVLLIRDRAIQVVLQDLNFGLEGALGHGDDHALDLFLQFCLAFSICGLAQVQFDPFTACSHASIFDGFVYISQFGLHFSD